MKVRPDQVLEVVHRDRLPQQRVWRARCCFFRVPTRYVKKHHWTTRVSIDPIDVNEGFAVSLPAPRIKLDNLSGWGGTKPFTNSGSKLEQSWLETVLRQVLTFNHAIIKSTSSSCELQSFRLSHSSIIKHSALSTVYGH